MQSANKTRDNSAEAAIYLQELKSIIKTCYETYTGAAEAAGAAEGNAFLCVDVGLNDIDDFLAILYALNVYTKVYVYFSMGTYDSGNKHTEAVKYWLEQKDPGKVEIVNGYGQEDSIDTIKHAYILSGLNVQDSIFISTYDIINKAESVYHQAYLNYTVDKFSNALNSTDNQSKCVEAISSNIRGGKKVLNEALGYCQRYIELLNISTDKQSYLRLPRNDRYYSLEVKTGYDDLPNNEYCLKWAKNEADKEKWSIPDIEDGDKCETELTALLNGMNVDSKEKNFQGSVFKKRGEVYQGSFLVDPFAVHHANLNAVSNKHMAVGDLLLDVSDIIEELRTLASSTSPSSPSSSPMTLHTGSGTRRRKKNRKRNTKKNRRKRNTKKNRRKKRKRTRR